MDKPGFESGWTSALAAGWMLPVLVTSCKEFSVSVAVGLVPSATVTVGCMLPVVVSVGWVLGWMFPVSGWMMVELVSAECKEFPGTPPM